MAANPNQTNLFTAWDILPVTPSDTVDLAVNARALRAAVAGTIRITTLSGAVRDTRIGEDVPLTVGAIRVHATGTTATGIEALI